MKMEEKDLYKVLKEELRVEPPESLRAALYLEKIRSAKKLFTTTLKKELGNKYCLVETALKNPNLLDILCKSLDSYVRQALLHVLLHRKIGGNNEQSQFEDFVAKRTKKQTKNITELERTELVKAYLIERLEDEHLLQYYKSYFKAKILSRTDDGYSQNIGEFFSQYPRTKYAIDKVTDQFTNNICLACTRVVKDWEDIKTVFFTDTGKQNPFNQLVEIHSTGSDSHKGGQQVLILIFNSGRKLVYKPSDVEADCLLIGNNTKKAVQGFFGDVDGSLMEILNQRIKESPFKANLQQLPTYKFLPRNYGTSTPSPAIKESYGYIEFLHHESPGGAASSVSSVPKSGHGNYEIGPKDDKETICRNFYCLIGQLIATACTFSLTDLHYENLIVHDYKPFLIDLESSLIYGIDKISRTGLFIERDPHHASITGTVGQCRLWDSTGNAPTRIEPTAYLPSIQEGFEKMLEVLRSNVADKGIDVWFKRLEGVVVRHVPIDTQRFGNALKLLCNYKGCTVSMDSFDHDVGDKMRRIGGQAYNNWLIEVAVAIEVNPILAEEQKKVVLEINPTLAKKLKKDLVEKARNVIYNTPRFNFLWTSMDRVFPPPKFFALNKPYIISNFRELEVPVYYHRIGTNTLLNYDGVEIGVEEGDFVQKDFKNSFKTISSQASHYFPATIRHPKSGLTTISPTQKYVKNGRFGRLADDEYFKKRKHALMSEIVQTLLPRSSSLPFKSDQ